MKARKYCREFWTCWGEWAVENSMKMNPSKSQAIRFTRARLKDSLNYSIMGTLIPEASSCKYLRIILRSDLIWADHVKYTVKKAWKALHFTMRFFNMVPRAGIRTRRDNKCDRQDAKESGQICISH